MSLKQGAFNGEKFVWGTSSSAFQTEGAYLTDGKGESVWDVFTQKKGKIKNNENARVACDFYHNYKSDLGLMAELGIRAFRFSISWSRILPEGTGRINQKGIDFYNRVIDECRRLGIEPWITLYHWDLPQYLELKGGWTNRDVVSWFTEYTQVCIKNFADRVKYWMVLNEPSVFTGAGYFLGIHAPGRRGISNYIPAIHHAALCQAEGGRVIKAIAPESVVGTTFSCTYIEPFSNREKDIQAALRADALLNRMFIEPLTGKGYPTHDLKFLERIERYIKSGDREKLAFNMDFIGIQNYTREVVKHTYFMPYIQAKMVKASKRRVKTTAMGWEVYPDSLYFMLKRYSDDLPGMPLIVTENGAAFHDVVYNQQVQDTDRSEYIKQSIITIKRAEAEGIQVKGYFVWSFTDNFEWAEGYHPRFGLVYVDFTNQVRIVKSSGRQYGEFIKNQIINP